MKPDAPLSAADLVKQLEAKRAWLDQNAQSLLQEMLSLEKANVIAEQPTGLPTPSQLKARWLNGHGEPIAAAASPANRLFEIHRDRAGIAAARVEIERKLFAAMVRAGEEFMATHAKRWADIQRARVQALLALRRANAEAAAFRNELAGISGGMITPPADRILGAAFRAPHQYDDESEFFQHCVRERIITAREIAE